MLLAAPLHVTAEIRVLDTGPQVERAFRLTAAADETGLRVAGELPWEPGRKVVLQLTLPDAASPLALFGVVASRQEIAFTNLDECARQALRAYVQERTLAE